MNLRRAVLHPLRRRGALPLVAVVMLAVAIGANTAVFSIVHAVLLRPLPFSEPERLVMLWGHDPAVAVPVIEVSTGDLRGWRTQNSTLSGIDVFGSVNWGFRVTAPGEPFSVSYSSVSAGFFDTLGVKPMLGRTFRPDDDRPGAPATVVLSFELWRRRFSADPVIVGKAITIGEGVEAQPYEVIGVMGSGFRFPAGAEAWRPAVRDFAEIARKQKDTDWKETDWDNLRVYYGLGRLKAGVSVERAASDLSVIARRLESERKQASKGTTVVVTPIQDHMLGAAKPALVAIFGAVAILLLIACANAACLLLVDGVARAREIAVRLAIGASRWRIARQLLGEAAVLVSLSAILGVALAWLTFDVLVALAPSEVPGLHDASINVNVLAFALGVCLIAPFLVGILPAWQLSRAELVDSLKEGSRTGSVGPRTGRTRQALVVAQLAAALVLLLAAGLVGRSFMELMRLDLGFEPKNVLTFDLYAPETRYGHERERALVADVVTQLERLPGAVAAGAILQRPFKHGPIGMDSGFILEGQPKTPDTWRKNPLLNWESVTPGYFRTMDIALTRGRLFTERDDERAPLVVVVSEALAARVWPGQDPLGKKLQAFGATRNDKPEWQTVVGVVENARYREIEAPRFDIYVPSRQAPSLPNDFVVRTANEPLAVLPALRAALERIDPELDVENAATMEEIVGRTVAPWRFNMVVFTVYSATAVAFAAIGLFALIAYAAKQRTREIGVRVALGAKSSDVVRLFVGEGARLAVAGLAIGIPAAWILSRLLSSLLFAVSPTDAATFVVVAGVLGLVSLLAAYLPARRAGTVDPVVALRSE
jgi:putative ABC transport system permease protein